MKHAKNFLTQETLKARYSGIVEPHFRYCCSVWSKCGAIEKKHLQKLKNRAARVLTNNHFDADARPLLNTLGLNRVEDMIDTEINTMVFKALNSLTPKYILDVLIRNSENYL